MGFQPSFLLLHPALLKIKAKRKEQQLRSHILLSGGQKSVKAKVVLYQSKGTFNLNGSVHSQMDAPFAGDILQRLLPLLPEGFFHNDFLRRIHILLPAAFFSLWTILTAVTSIPYACHRNAVLYLCGYFSAM